MMKIQINANTAANPSSKRDKTKNTDSKPTLKENLKALRNLPKLFLLVWRTHRGLTLSTILLRLLRTGLPLATLYVAKLIIDEVILQLKTPNPDWMYLWTLVAIEFGLALLSEILNRIISLVEALLGDLFSNANSVQLMRHAATLDLAMFEDATFYDKLARARQQTIGRVTLISQMLSQVQDIITLIVLGIGLAFFNGWLILILVVAIIPSFFNETYFNRSSYSLVKSWTPERRELDYLRYVGASDLTAKEVKIFGLADFLADRFHALAHRYYLANRNLAIRRMIWGLVFSILGSVGYYAAYIYIVWQTIQGTLSIGDLTFLAGSFSRMQGLLQGILARFSEIAQNALYLQDLFDFLDMRPQIHSPEKPTALPVKFQQGFTFEEVGFKYPNSEVWAVRRLSFRLKAGEKLALVGENGAGKTTITKLIARLYEPDEGRILLDGRDIRDYDLEEYQRIIGVIFQDFIHFQMSASVNIAVGKILEKENQSQITRSAEMSLADTVIAKLPKGYDQVLGKWFQDGQELSGGEWQKIALARAYMREAQLLILDEPTAALDARAEYEVFQRFAGLTEGKTSILISHRFSTVRMADRILVLKKGEMQEIGSHEELLAQEGLYAELFNLQAEGYK
jgi:ATP-binding cassette subfamily B protein